MGLIFFNTRLLLQDKRQKITKIDAKKKVEETVTNNALPNVLEIMYKAIFCVEIFFLIKFQFKFQK